MTSLTSSAPSSGDKILHLMRHGSDGDPAALRELFRLLQSEKLFVPKRRQARPLSDSPQYPNELIDVLGVQNGDRVVVPVFSSPELIEQWSGIAFEHREIGLAELRSILPQDWWLVINAGQEVEKEVSPWELERLATGDSGVAEILEDLEGEQAGDGFKIEGVESKEFPKLYQAAREFFESQSELDSIYWAKEHRRTRSGDFDVSLILGVETVSRGMDTAPFLDKLKRIADKAMIGDIPVRVLTPDKAGGNFLRQVLRHYPPLAQRIDLWSRLRRMLLERLAKA